jgi:uroporphyrinogen III methyltransferase/synthase
MTVKNIKQVCQKLIENGRSPDTSVAVVRWGTRAEQTTLTGSLSNIPDLVRENEIRPPAVMVVGNVVKLRDKLRWFENKPLFGQRILVTREHSDEFERLEEFGAEILEFHTIKIVPPESWADLDRAIDRIGTYQWIVMTSVNSVNYFFRRLREKERDIRDLKGIKLCTVGSKTASAIRGFGINVDLVPEKFNAEGLVDAFMAEYRNKNSEGRLDGIKILMPRAEIAREVFPQKVREMGGEIDVPAAYTAVKPDYRGKRLKRFLKGGRVSIATFTSAATFNNFVDMLNEDGMAFLKDVSIAVIGPVTAKAIEKAGLKVSIMPEEATIEAMVDEILKWAEKKQTQLT